MIDHDRQTIGLLGSVAKQRDKSLGALVRTVLVVLAASILTTMLLVVPRGHTAHVRAQSAGSADLLAQLAERLLATSPSITPPPGGYPFGLSSSPVQLFPGALPADLPLTLPMPPTSTLIGSAARPSYPRPAPFIVNGGSGFPAATPSPTPSGTHVDIVLDASGTAADIMRFYADALTKLGWSPPASPPFGPGGGGFVSSSAPSSSNTFCQSADGPWLTITVLPVTSGPQDVRLALDTGNAGACGSPYTGIAAPPTPIFPPGLGLLPRLEGPAGVTVQTTIGSSGGPGRWNSEAIATTDMSVSDLEAAYEQELVATGWMRAEGGSAAALAWSTWSLPDQSDWQGFLYVRSGPGDGRRSLHIEVASASTQTASGPYYGSYGPTYAPPAVIPVPASASMVIRPTATPTPTPTPSPASR